MSAFAESANTVDVATASSAPPVTELSSESAAALLGDLPVDVVSRLTPLHYGDLAALGLASWTPAGLCQWSLELLQVSTGMPWFWAIVGATVISRLIILPFAIKGIRNSARMGPHQAEFDSLREDINKARLSKDVATMQRAVIKQQLLYKKIGVSVGGMMVPPLVQLPITLGMFFGIKKMCDLPVEQLKSSGVDFLQDLTVPDPTYVLPVLATIGMNVGLSVRLLSAYSSAILTPSSAWYA